MKRGKPEPLTDDIPELTAQDFARGISRKQRERIRRSHIAGGDDIVALRRFTGLTQDQFAKALALLRVAARHPRVLTENLAVPV